MRSRLLCGCTALVVFAAAVLGLAQEKPKADSPQGFLPKSADGRSLNLDFEAGDLRDWEAGGEAFEGQPIKGDTVVARRNDMRSEHAGEFWIGTYERKGDTPQGTLTSVPFKVTHKFAAFLIGGGPSDATRVELLRGDTQRVFYKTSGDDRE